MRHNTSAQSSISNLISAFRHIALRGGLQAVAAIIILASCSTTSKLRDGEQLFIGLEKIEYTGLNEDKTEADHLATTKEEVEASLAKDLKRRGTHNALPGYTPSISFGVAAVSFFIGWAAKTWMGIEM